MNLSDIVSSFILSLEAQNKTEKTRTAYLEGIHRLQEFLQKHKYSQEIHKITKPILEEFILEQVRIHSANTAITRYTALRRSVL